MKTIQFWVIMVMLGVSAGLEQARGDVDKVPPSEALSGFPTQLDAYDSTEIPISDDALAVMGKGFFLDRMYVRSPALAAQARAGETFGPVELFIGYFPTQRTGQTIHSPQHCLPGAGWIFDSSGTVALNPVNGRENVVGDYLISNGNAKSEVLYWYRSHGRTVANDWTAKLYTLSDSILYSRTDAALIRIVTPVFPNEGRASAQARAIGFANRITPLLPAYIPD